MEEIAKKVLELFGSTSVSAFFAGLAGGVVALRFEKEKITIRRSLGIICFGVIGSIYLGGIVVEIFNFSENTENGIRFICGLTAVRLFESLLFIADMIKSDPIGAFKKLFGNGNTKK